MTEEKLDTLPKSMETLQKEQTNGQHDLRKWLEREVTTGQEDATQRVVKYLKED